MKKVLLITIISLTATVSVAGLSYKFFHKNNEEISNIDEDDPLYRNEVMDKPTSGDPSTTDPLDNLFIAQGEFLKQKYKSTITNGNCNAVIYGINQNQTVHNRKYINVDEAFQESISNSSIVHVAKQRYVTSNDYLIRNGKNGTITENSASFEDVKAITRESYLNQFGSFPFNFTNYVLNKESVNSYEVIENGENFVCKYNLNVDVATVKYARETKTMAGSSSLPSFVGANIVVTMDKNWIVSQIDTYDEYDIDIIARVRCKARLQNYYYYQTDPYNIPEREIFSKYFGSIPIEGDEVIEKTSQDYLMDAANQLLNDEKGVNIRGNIKVNDKNIKLNAFINLASKIIKVNLNDALNIFYQDENLYFNYGKIFAKVSMDELVDVINYYLGINIKTFDISSLLENENVASSLQNMNTVKDGDMLKLTLTMFPVVIKLNLKINNENVASFTSIDLNLNVKDIKVQGNIAFVKDSYFYKSIPDNVETISNVKNNIVSIQQFLAKENYNIKLDFDYKDVVISVDAYLNVIKDKFTLQAEAKINYNEEEFDVSLSYIDDYLYLSYENNIALKLSLEETQLLVTKIDQIFNLGLSDKANMFDSSFIENLNFENIVESISCNSDGLSGKVNLTEFGFNSILDLDYIPDQEIKLNIPHFGSISVKNSEAQELKAVPEAYMCYQDIALYLDTISDLLDGGSAGLDLDLALAIDEKTTMAIDGHLDLNFKVTDKPLKDSFEFYFDINISVLDYSFNVTGGYQDNNLYISLLGKNIVLSYQDVKDVINVAAETFALDKKTINEVYNILENDIHSISLSNSISSIKNVISMIEIVSDKISFNIGKNQISLDAIDKENLILGISSLGEANIHLSEDNIDLGSFNQSSDLSKNDLITIIKTAQKIVSQIDVRDLKISANFSYKNIDIVGDLYIHIQDGEKFNVNIDGTITLIYNNENIILNVQYINNSLYLSYKNNIGINLEYEQALSLINKVLTKIGQEPLNMDFNVNKLDIESMLGNISSDDSILFVDLDLTQFGLSTMKLSYSLIDNNLILVDEKSLEIVVSTSTLKEVLASDVDYYLTYEDLNSYLDMGFAYYENKMIKLDNLDVAFNSNGISIGINGYALIGFDNGLKIEGQFDIFVSDILIPINLTLIDNTIYINMGNINIVLNNQEFMSLIEDVEKAFVIDLSSIKNYLNLNSSTIELSINKILDGVKVNKDQLSLALDLFDNQIEVNINKQGEINVTLDEKGSFTLNNFPSTGIDKPMFNEYIGSNDLKQAIKIAQDAYNYKDNESFTFSFDGSATGANYSGNLIMCLKPISETNNTKYIDEFEINLNVEETAIPRSHTVKIIYTNKNAYIYYSNNNGNSMNLHIDEGSALQLLSDINSLTIKNEFISSILKDLTVSNNVDIFSYYDKGESENIDASKLLQSLTIDNKKMNLKLDINNGIYDVSLGSNENNLLLANVICDSFDLNVETNALSGSISTINQEEYIDISSIDELMQLVINTINLREYHIRKTNFVVDVMGIKIEATIQIDAIVDENNKPLLFISIEVPSVIFVVSNKTNSKIVYDGEYIYCERCIIKKPLFGSEQYTYEYVKWTLQEFMDDAMNKIYYIANLTDTIQNTINNAIKDSNDGNNNYMDFDDILKSYSYVDNKYSLSLNGVELCQDKNVGDINLIIYPNSENKLIGEAELTMKLVSIITLSADLVLLDNNSSEINPQIFVDAQNIITKTLNA